MRRERTLVLTGFALFVVACSQQSTEKPGTSAVEQSATAPEPKPEPLPQIDSQSPDNLIKSYWALQDWLQRNQQLLGMRLQISDELRSYLQERIALGTGEFRAKQEAEYAQLNEFFTDTSEKKVIQRDLIEVRNESDTRAVVLAKIRNITPVPAGLDLSSWAEEREYGLDVRYVVERTSDGWRLAQAWKRSATDIKWDKDTETGDAKTGGWKKVWEVPKQDSSEPGVFHYVSVDP